jgi:hypothetical protein
MPELAAFQDAFAEALLADAPVGPVARQPGFSVHRNTSARGSVEALRSAFPTIALLLGDEMFGELALAYRNEQPPATPVLAAYGACFPNFLARQLWVTELPYVPDVARLDWLWLESLLARDCNAARSPSKWDGTQRIVLNPTTRFAWTTTPAMTIWQAHRSAHEFVELTPEWREEGALFVRRGFSVQAQPIGRPEHLLLVACAAGTRFNDCVAAVAAAHPEADVVNLFVRCLALGALTIL